MKELICEYEVTLKETRKRIAEVDKELATLKEIYRDKNLEKRLRIKAKEAAEPLNHDKSILVSMEDSLIYALEWMKTARQPGTRRGVENLAAYQREIPVDPSHFEYTEYQEWDEKGLSELERERLDYVLSKLSKREKEVYVMSKGKGYSQYYIAEVLKISRSTVQVVLNRADEKVKLCLSNMVI